MLSLRNFEHVFGKPRLKFLWFMQNFVIHVEDNFVIHVEENFVIHVEDNFVIHVEDNFAICV